MFSNLIFDEKLKFSNFNLLKNLKILLEGDKIGGDWNVFIDYAHTPDALSVLSNLKKIVKVIFLQSLDVVVIETERKYMMTKKAIKFSDLVIITDDNPRNENPAKIRKEMVKN